MVHHPNPQGKGAVQSFSFTTHKPYQLPVVDVSVWLGRDRKLEEVVLQLGPVCFSR